MAMYSAQTFMLCHDHIEWLTDMAVRHELREVEGHGDETDAVLQRLIDYCNSGICVNVNMFMHVTFDRRI